MRTEYFGGDEPELAVVGGIHGDEPCGVAAIEQLLSEAPTLNRPVVFVVANEKALAAETRYLEEDLNRAFPGDASAATHEQRLAAQLHDVIGDCLTFSMHSTQSYGGPFALVDGVGPDIRVPLRELSVDAVVDVGRHSAGRVFEAVPRTIEVECGYQGSAGAAENATRLLREFLTATGALSENSESAPEPGEYTERNDTPLFRLDRQIPKAEADSYEVYVDNFTEVAEGEPFAVAGEDLVVADEPFYPVLLSANGYERVFGYTAARLGTLAEHGRPGGTRLESTASES